MTSILLPKGILAAGSAIHANAAGSLTTGFALHPATFVAATVAGALIDQFVLFPRLFGSEPEEGPRLSGVDISDQLEGAPQNRCFGRRVRVPLTMVWRSEIREVKVEENAGAKGGSGSSFIAYKSFIHLGYQICRGPIASVVKVWADGDLIFNAVPDLEEQSDVITTTTDTTQAFGNPEPTVRLILTSDMEAGGPDLSELKSGKLATVSGYPNTDPLSGAELTGVFSDVLRLRSTTGGTLNVDDTFAIEGIDARFVVTAGVTLAPNVQTNVSVRPDPERLIRDTPFGAAVVTRRGVGSNNGPWEVFRSSRDDTLGAQTSTVELQSPDLTNYPFAASAAGDALDIFQSEPQFRETNAAAIRFQTGLANQQPDPLLVENEAAAVGGQENLYAARGRAMMWVEDFELTDFARPPFFEALVEVTADADVADVLTAIAEDYGLTPEDLDVEAVRGLADVEGYTVRGPQTGKSILQPLQIAYHLLTREFEGRIVFEDRANLPTTLTLDASSGDLAVASVGDEVPRPLEALQYDSRNLPDSIVMSYRSIDEDHQERSVRKRSIQPDDFQEESMSVAPLALEADTAQDLVNTLFDISQASRRRFRGTVTQEHLPHLYPGAKVEIRNALGRDWTTIVTQLERGANFAQEFEARVEQEQVFVPEPDAEAEFVVASQAASSQSSQLLPASSVLWHAISLGPLRDEEADRTGFYVAATNGDPRRSSRGFFVYLRDGDQGEYARVATIDQAAVLARATTAPSSTGISHLLLDRRTVLRIQLEDPSRRLSSVTESSMVAGRNRFLWGDEIIGAANVHYVSEGVYDLSILMRGLKDTDDAMQSHALGDRIVWLDGPGLTFVPLDLAAMETTRQVKVIGNGGSLDDASGRPVFYSGRNVKPYRLVNFVGERQFNNDVLFSWERQTRVTTQFLDTGEPLGEDEEVYLIEIINTLGDVVRTFRPTDTVQVYTAGQQASDAIVGAFDAQGRQLSRRMHYGVPVTITIPAP